jgi:hypothetical protein
MNRQDAKGAKASDLRFQKIPAPAHSPRLKPGPFIAGGPFSAARYRFQGGRLGRKVSNSAISSAS